MSVIYINLEDVRKVLAEHQIDPRHTNAAKIRELLGRGGPNTIQKHLDALRLEIAHAEAPPASPAQIPAAPADLVSQVWGAAWTAAQLAAVVRIERLSVERDAALAQVEVLTQDRDGLLADAELQIEKLIAAEAATQEALSQYHTACEMAESMRKDASDHFSDFMAQRDGALSQLESERREAKHAAQLAEAKHSGMKEHIAHLTDQLGELKAHLYSLAQGKNPTTESPTS